MIASSAKTISDIVAWLRQGQRASPHNGGLKLNLGSYLQVCEGWVNIDGSHHILFRKLPRRALLTVYRHSQVKHFLSEEEYVRRLKYCKFVHHNLLYGIPFPDESVECIYSSHFLEHLYQDQSECLLREAYRVLKKGGSIRICVPDLEHAINIYSQDKRKALDYFFQPSKAHSYERHRYMFDFELMEAVLETAGFSDVTRCEYRNGKVPNLETLDNRPEETLYVEAVK